MTTKNPLLEEARATGAHVMVGDPTAGRILLPIFAGWRGCALSYLYALRHDVAENERGLAAARSVLGRYQPDPERQPHLVMRIDDPRHADHWRGWHTGTSSQCFEDALSSPESTACALVSQVLRTGARQLLLCEDSTLALAILLELGRRAWEQQQLIAAAAGHDAQPDASPNGDSPARFPVESVLLLECWTGGHATCGVSTWPPLPRRWPGNCPPSPLTPGRGRMPNSAPATTRLAGRTGSAPARSAPGRSARPRSSAR